MTREPKPGPAASSYRVYWLNDSGGIAAADWVHAGSESEALEVIQGLARSATWELWQRARWIAASS